MVKITPQQIFTTQWKNSYPHQNFQYNTPPPSFLPTGTGDFSPSPLMLFGKPWHVSPFHITSIYLSVSLWIATQFNTPKNEMPLKVLLVIGNGFLISAVKIINLNFKEWKYSQDYSLMRALSTLLSKIVYGLSLCFN